MMKHLIVGLATMLGLMMQQLPPEADADDGPAAGPAAENLVYLELETGRVTIALRPDKAPKTVARFKQLIRDDFYDGQIFHRVIEGFMAQTGDPTGTGRGGSGKNLEAEFNDLPHMRGTVSMARAEDPNSADSQWFIAFNRLPHLDGDYTAFGRVIAGMEHVDQIKRGEPPQNPSKIMGIEIAADVDDGAADAATTQRGSPEEGGS
ncbi:peptidylprolyl isomerase [Yunchengibacter salinarum]|uniref:peptidylprolyl isomerase n=1 Tax=Yunchengibacter salinarum TaxID=3133399 RepID=UPI0035B653A7